MSITDELREWAQVHYGTGYSCQILAIADRIDAEHEACEFFCRRVEEAANERSDVTMWGVDYIALPLDADGVPIHVGDYMERLERRGKVVALQLSDNPWGDGNHWAIQLEGEQAPTVLDTFFRHHREPTVEDVLREFAEKFGYLTTNGEDERELLADYVKRLQLRGEGE